MPTLISVRDGIKLRAFDVLTVGKLRHGPSLKKIAKSGCKNKRATKANNLRHKTMSKSEQRNFAKRFTLEDWGWLCTNGGFCHTLDNGTRVDAATLAALLLQCRRVNNELHSRAFDL